MQGHAHQQPPIGDRTDGAIARSPDQWACVIGAASALLTQCEEFLRDVPAAVYSAESEVLPGGTVGRHLRHVVDHYVAIVTGASGAGAIDYDHRRRDTPMESDREAALAVLADVRRQVAALSCMGEATPVRVRVMLTGDGAEAVLVTTLARELAFATHHGVHHQAMMRAIAGEFGVEASREFGKAPSTIHHALASAGGHG
jgi:uncharacterized damage-inducible protein DinB